MDNTPCFIDGFDTRFVFELALASEPVEGLLQRYNVSIEQYENYLQNVAFQAQLQKFRADIHERGLGFREKARALSEDMLVTAYRMVKDENVPATVKADLIKWVAKVADLEPKQDKNPESQFLPNVLISIQQMSNEELDRRVANLVARKQQNVIDVTPTLQ